MSKKVKTHGAGGGGSGSSSSIAQEATTASLLGELLTGLEASPWGLSLVHDNLDPSARLALYCTGKPASDFMLVTAEQATVTLGMEDNPMVARQLLAVKAALIKRGPTLRTKLILNARDTSELSFALGALVEGMGAVGELHVMVYPFSIGGPHAAGVGKLLPTTIMATIGDICPNLRVLHTSTVLALPSRELFPSLQELSLQLPSDDDNRLEHACRSIAPYIPQLTFLSLRMGGIGAAIQPALPLLLNPTNTGARLRTLRIDATLDDALLGLLLQCMPALEEVDVRSVRLASDAHAHAQTNWQQLCCREIRFSSLARLPLAADLQLSTGWATLHCDTTSVDAAAAARLKALQFDWLKNGDKGGVNLQWNHDTDEADQAAALRVALSLLRMHTAACDSFMIYLNGFTMTGEVMLELQGLPTCKPGSRVIFGDELCWLADPDLYGTLLRLLPDTCTSVFLDFSNPGEEEEGYLTREQVMSICLGAPVNRAPEAPLEVILDACDRDVADEMVQAVQHRMQQLVFPSVNVVHCDTYL